MSYSCCEHVAIPCKGVFVNLAGHVSKILSDDAPLQLAEWTNTYGPIYKIQLNNSPAVVLTDPAAITSLIRWPSSPTYITKSPDIYGALELGTQPQLHNILTSTDNAYWKAVRQGTAPCFSVSNLKQVFPWVLHLCSKAVQKVHETAATPAANGTTARDHTAVIAAEVNVVDIAKRFTSDVMGHMLFAEDLKGMDMGKSMYIDLFSKLLEEVHQNIANPLRKFMIWSADAKQGKEALKTHDKLMGDKLEAMLANPPPDYTITGHLLKVVDPATGKRLVRDQLKAEIAIMMGAGFETTSHAISWTLAALAAHSEVQQTLQIELAAAGLAPPVGDSHNTVSGDDTSSAAQSGGSSNGALPPREIDWSDLTKLPYLNAVIKEGLRVFSPASLGTTRYCHKELEVLGHKLPKGTCVIIPPYPIGASQHNYGPTANYFIPERWLEPQQLQQVQRLKSTAMAAGNALTGSATHGDNNNGSSSDSGSVKGNGLGQHDPVAVVQAGSTTAASALPGSKAPEGLAFLIGPRDCMGQTLARIELQALIATLVGHFKLEPSQKLAADLATAAAGADGTSKANGGDSSKLGFNPVTVLKQSIMYHITLQPRDDMKLKLTPRY
eukprot:GHRR01020534.1.p1 GENE.GHRR01020534.1~~GHRR01020534.1.p1  ORF type:complete len:610 (+),score=222.87 GHRR01020534.1:694-2523(+)